MQASSNQVTQQQPFLPLELSVKYYVKWDCDIQTKSTPNGYFKCLQGKGQVELANGNKYKGNFYNGLMNGQGKFEWTNGLTYTGQFLNNAITGIGHYQWQDGSWYKGSVLNGKRHGKGEYFCSKDSSKYNGEWLQGLRHGYGLLEFNQQTSYEGQFYQGVRHGKGKMRYQSGNIYDGQWKNDKKCGQGVMNWLNESQKYEGQWKDDLQNGMGTYYWFDGKIEYKIIKNIYKGNWVNGQRHGYGSFFYSNGCRYEGYFAHNQKEGEGLVMDQNGNVKLECFKKDKLVYSIPDNGIGLNSNNQKKSGGTQKKGLQKKYDPSKQQSVQSSSRTGKLLSSVHKQSNNTSLTQQQLKAATQPQSKPQFPISSFVKEKQTKLKVEENIYMKCLDIPFFESDSKSLKSQQAFKRSEKFLINQQIANLILRENSHLRQWYKYCSASGSTGNNSLTANKDFYSGVTVQNLFKLVKDLKIIDQFTTIPKINRQSFYLGWKSTYDITLPNQQKLSYIKNYLQQKNQQIKEMKKYPNHIWDTLFNNQEINYSNIQWVQYTKDLECMQKDYQHQNDTYNDFKEKIDLNLFQDIHNPKKIILYRHFVTYLLRIAYLQTLKIHTNKNYSHPHFHKQFRHHLQKLFKTINNLYQGVQKDQKTIISNDNLTFVSKEKVTYNVSEEYTKLNQELFKQITANYQNLNNFSDNTIPAKVLLQILQKFDILKQATEKILFLQKIERFMQPQFNKHSLLRKDQKQHFSAIEKVIYTSPYFHRMLSYPLIEREFEQLLYLAVNRKIVSSSKQDAIKKYRQVIDKIIAFVKTQAGKFSKPLQKKFNLKLPVTEKDQKKKKLLEEEQQRIAALKQAQRKRLQLKRQQIERQKMQKQDFRWEQEQSESSEEYFD